ncbi:zinc finger protein 425 [Anopheles darlingi]|uniref:Zinc finger protein 425 n=1 Tax=Anopheles darlingi TaxID=43151 RepID=W5JU38_ANODA|nr:zinc finger protein 425 [Anopheles darlingi]
MKEKCRLCLTLLECSNSISLSDSEFYMKLATLFQFNILVDNALPNQVCSVCQSSVNSFYTFHQDVEANQMLLLALQNDKDPIASFLPEPRVEECVVEILAETAHNGDDDDDDENSPSQPVEDEQDVEIYNNDNSLDDEGGGNDDKGFASEDDERSEKVHSKTDDEATSQPEVVAVAREGQEELKPRRRGRPPGKRNRKKTLSPVERPKPRKQNNVNEKEERIADFVKLQNHYREAHGTAGYVRCCNKQFFRRYLLLDHIAAHIGTIRCEICQKSYKSSRYLALHMAKAHGSEEDRPYKCEVCQLSFPKTYLLKTHQTLHVRKQCHLCNKVLSSQQSLRVHLAQMHSDDNQQICATCGKLFRTKQAMERHIKEHRGEQLVDRMQCEYCKKWFNGKYNLRKHIRFIHNEDGQVFRCDICQHESPNSRALQNHKQRVHVEEKFECTYCGKRFKRQTSLREHMASHTGKPLYSCEVCGITFNSKANRFSHRKNKHPVEWAANKRLKEQRELNETDPGQACQPCHSLVSQFYEFSLQVEENQQQLWTQHREGKIEDVKVELDTENHLFYHVDVDDLPPASVKQELAEHCGDNDGDIGDEDNDDKNDSDYLPKTEDPQIPDGHDGEEDVATIVVANVRKTKRIKLRKRHPRMAKADKPIPQPEPETEMDPETEKEDTEEQSKQNEDDQRIKEFYNLDCELCSAKLENLATLQSHYRRKHEIKGYIRCCDKLFYRRFQLLDHMAAHQGTIRCKICNKSYKSSRYLALHTMKSHSKEEDRPFKCTKCRQSFHKEHLLKAHQANHLSEKCPICEKVVSSKYALKTHVAHMHGNDGNHICDVCGKEFRTKQAMERHINEHLGLEVVQKVQCHECNRWFHGKYNLRKHIRFMHIEDGQVFRCEICQHESPNSRALLDHKKRVHVDEKFECEFCGKRFKRKLYLREHIASHTGKPLYSCEVCGATFNSNANCYNHRKIRHPAEWEARKQAFLAAQLKSPTTEPKKDS